MWPTQSSPSNTAKLSGLSAFDALTRVNIDSILKRYSGHLVTRTARAVFGIDRQESLQIENAPCIRFALSNVRFQEKSRHHQEIASAAVGRVRAAVGGKANMLLVQKTLLMMTVISPLSGTSMLGNPSDSVLSITHSQQGEKKTPAQGRIRRDRQQPTTYARRRRCCRSPSGL